MFDYFLILKKKKTIIVRLGFNSIDEIALFLKYFYAGLPLKQCKFYSYTIFKESWLKDE